MVLTLQINVFLTLLPNNWDNLKEYKIMGILYPPV